MRCATACSIAALLGSKCLGTPPIACSAPRPAHLPSAFWLGEKSLAERCLLRKLTPCPMLLCMLSRGNILLKGCGRRGRERGQGGRIRAGLLVMHAGCLLTSGSQACKHSGRRVPSCRSPAQRGHSRGGLRARQAAGTGSIRCWVAVTGGWTRDRESWAKAVRHPRRNTTMFVLCTQRNLRHQSSGLGVQLGSAGAGAGDKAPCRLGSATLYEAAPTLSPVSSGCVTSFSLKAR